MTDRRVLVYIDLAGTPQLVGRLWGGVRKGRESATFEYDKPQRSMSSSMYGRFSASSSNSVFNKPEGFRPARLCAPKAEVANL